MFTDWHELATKRILVIGEALIDIVQGVEIVGGSPANVALGLGRLGANTELLTALGNDERGNRIANHLTASHVTVLRESFTLHHTSTARASLRADGSAVYDFDIDWRLPATGLPSFDLLHVGSIACFLEPGASVLAGVIRDASERGARVTFDPNIRPALVDPAQARARVEEIARFASAVKLSDEDAELIYPGASLESVLENLLALGPGLVAITRGGSGAMIATPTQRVTVAAPPTTVVDTVGAGDTFMAAMIACLSNLGDSPLHRDDLTGIGEFCVKAAALTVARAGADLPRLEELAGPS